MLKVTVIAVVVRATPVALLAGVVAVTASDVVVEVPPPPPPPHEPRNSAAIHNPYKMMDLFMADLLLGVTG
jgi:hypothetical protein